MIMLDKGPAATLDFGRNWADWLAAGEVITDSTWTIVASGEPDTTPLIKDPDRPPGWVGSQTYVWLTQGTLERYYRVINRITTNAGRTDERTYNIRVVNR